MLTAHKCFDKTVSMNRNQANKKKESHMITSLIMFEIISITIASAIVALKEV
jgi:hypothetical protein